MKKFLKATAIYGLYWLVYFFLARFIFLLAQFRETIQYTPSEILQTYFHGFRLDLSATGYILLPPVFMGIPWFLFRGNWYLRFIRIYSGIIIAFFTTLVLGDAVVYSFWGYRVDFSVAGYFSNPKDALASASTLQLTAGIVTDVFIIFLLIRLCNKLTGKYYKIPEKGLSSLISVPVLLILTGSLIIPIRGGLGVAPINAGSAFFSEHLFLNHTALNVVWNFGHTAVYHKPVINPYQFTTREEALKNFKVLMHDDGNNINVLKKERPNLLLIVLESFGSEIINMGNGDSSVAPRFREYIREGIYFSDFYAAGSRTDKAIPAIFSGYPNLPAIQVIREPRKTQKMLGIFKMLDSAGYKTSFWYGGDINFANINSFVTSTGFREKVTMNDFDRKDRNSKWGVHDHVVFERLYDSLSVVREPFAYAVLSLSSHEPFEVPMEPVFRGRDILSRFKNSVFYTDKSIGEFLDRAKNSDWWERTLVIILADHCRRNSESVPAYSESIFKIPMLWLGGAIAVKDTIIDYPCSQFDLPVTIASQLKLNGNFPFSKNILSTGANHFAFYTYNEGFAFITDSSKVIYDIKLKECIKKEGSGVSLAERYGKSFLQILFDDYLSR